MILRDSQQLRWAFITKMSPLRTRAKVSNPPSRHFGENRRQKRYSAETVARAHSSRTLPQGGQNAWRLIFMGEWQNVVLTSSTWHLIYFKLKCPGNITEKEKRLNIQKNNGKISCWNKLLKKHSNVLRPLQLLSYKHKLQNSIQKQAYWSPALSPLTEFALGTQVLVMDVVVMLLWAILPRPSPAFFKALEVLRTAGVVSHSNGHQAGQPQTWVEQSFWQAIGKFWCLTNVETTSRWNI